MRTNAAAADPPRMAVAISPRLLSLRETIVLAGVVEREKEVRNDIHRGVLRGADIIRFDNSRLCFNWPYVLTFAAVYGNAYLDSVKLRRIALEKVFFVASGRRETNRRSLADVGLTVYHASLTGNEWRQMLSDCYFSRARVEIDNYLVINLGKACKEVKPRVDAYAEGLDRVEEKDPILGGAAVFRDTRLSVLHIGKMAERGVSVEEILEDYPQLTKGDVEFAKLYYGARPPVGRPRVDGELKHAELDAK
jgi:uncharacterized protein (DUF433 family)